MEDKTIPDRLRVDHLVLLLGKNPLPNAVAGKLLVKPSNSMTMLYTSDTESSIKNIEDFLKDNVDFKEHVKIDEADASSIFRGIFNALEALKAKEGQSIGLHYTGGTKAMSVHAYRAVERWHSKTALNLKLVFSYLDARSLKIVFDPSDPEKDSVERIYVGNKVEILLKDLISLHGWSFIKKFGTVVHPVRQPLLPHLAAALASVHSNSELIEVWKEWTTKNLESGWTWPLPRDGLLKDVRQAMEEDLYCASGEIDGEISAQNLGIGNQELRLWLKGGFWLEHHTLQCLTEISVDLRLHDCYQAIKIAVPGGTDFDLDVAAMHGYQLFAFSCGVLSKPNEKGKLKLKLFEVYVRARQLGGDEARIALVSTSPDPHALQCEIYNEFDPEGHIRVFGQADLKDLKTALTSWIREKSHIE